VALKHPSVLAKEINVWIAGNPENRKGPAREAPNPPFLTRMPAKPSSKLNSFDPVYAVRGIPALAASRASEMICLNGCKPAASSRR
jgi:hypothetical protein